MTLFFHCIADFQLIVSVFSAPCCAHSFEGFKTLLQKYSSLSSLYFFTKEAFQVISQPSLFSYTDYSSSLNFVLLRTKLDSQEHRFGSLRRSTWDYPYKLAMQCTNSKTNTSPLSDPLHATFSYASILLALNVSVHDIYFC